MRTRIIVTMVVGVLCVVAVSQTRPETAREDVPGAQHSHVAYDMPRKRCDLANREIRESSGLAASGLRPDVLWTHNDSGDSARIFAFDLDGKDLGAYGVKGAGADDWEDMASFRLGGQSYLLLGDVGNNHSSRSVGTLYLVEEPRIGLSRYARLIQTVRFRYEDRPYNCEAIGFDPKRREVLLATKQIGFSTRVYVLAWPAGDTADTLVARHIGTIAVPIATAMDISPDGTRAVVLTYGHAYEYVRDPDEDWQQALARPGRQIVMPGRGQGESICFASDGHTLYLTSEQQPTPLFEVPVKDSP